MISLYKVRKPLRPVVAEAIGRGCWEIEQVGSKHTYRLRHRSGRLVPLHSSRVSEGRAPKKLKSQLARIERENPL